MKWLSRIPLELILWVTAILLLGAADPADHFPTNHFTLCPLANLGLSWCPGCGLGRSLIQLLHGNVTRSIQYHWIGIPALLIIGYRIFILGRYEIKKVINNKNKEKNYV